jgi:uncharacterized membrane protein
MKTTILITASALVLSLSAGCHGRSKTQHDAAVGAATGAVIGAVIGNQSGNPRTGAAIGAAVGGVAGGAYGNRQDRTLASSDSSSDYYLSLMTPDEVDILRARARASGRSAYELTDFLTPDERANLRRRDPSHHEIGQ